MSRSSSRTWRTPPHRPLRRNGRRPVRFAEPQIRKLADEITRIEALLAARKITADDASDRITMLEEAFQSVMGTAEAIAVLEVERAVNAVLAAMRAPVEKALGIKLA